MVVYAILAGKQQFRRDTLMKHLFGLFFVFSVVVTAAEPAGIQQMLRNGNIKCEGSWSGHLQGVAFDGKDKLYWVFNRHLVQTGTDGKLLNATMLKNEAGKLDHGGSPCYANGKIYVPYCGSGFNTELNGKPSYNFIQVYDEKDLSLVKSYSIPEVVYGAGAIVFADGSFFVAGGRPANMPGNTVYEYSPEFKLLKKHHLEFNSHLGIQSMTFDGKNFWFGCYSVRSGAAFRTGRDFKVKEYYNFQGAYGMVPLNNRKILLAVPDYSRKASGRATVTDLGKTKLTVVRLELDKDGRIFYNGKELSHIQLPGKLKPFRRKHIIISTPKELPAEKLVQVISIISHVISADFEIVLQ